MAIDFGFCHMVMTVFDTHSHIFINFIFFQILIQVIDVYVYFWGKNGMCLHKGSNLRGLYFKHRNKYNEIIII